MYNFSSGATIQIFDVDFDNTISFDNLSRDRKKPFHSKKQLNAIKFENCN